MASPLTMLSYMNRLAAKDERYDDRLARAANDAGGIDRTIAEFGASLLPESADTDPSKFATKTGAVKAAFKNDDARRNYVGKTEEIYTTLLAQPDLAAMHPSEMMSIASRAALEMPGAEGRTIKEDIFEHDLREETKWFGGKPGRALPGYEEYKKAKLAGAKDGENIFTRDFSPLDTLETAIFAGGGIAAAGYAAAGVGLAPILAGAGLGIGAYTLADQFLEGKLTDPNTSGKQKVVEFLADAGKHTLDLGMGALGGSGLFKAGTIAAKATTTAGKDVVLSQVASPSAKAIFGGTALEMAEWAAGTEGARIASNWYMDTDFAKAREGSWTNLILGHLGAGGAGFIGVGSGVKGLTNRFLENMAKGAVARGEYELASKSLLLTPKAENIIKAGEAQAQLDLVSKNIGGMVSERQKYLYDTLLASEKTTLGDVTKFVAGKEAGLQAGPRAVENRSPIDELMTEVSISQHKPADYTGMMPKAGKEATIPAQPGYAAKVKQSFYERFNGNVTDETAARTEFLRFTEPQVERATGLYSGTDMTLTESINKVAGEAKLQKHVAEFEPLYREFDMPPPPQAAFDSALWREQAFSVKPGTATSVQVKPSVTFTAEEADRLAMAGFDTSNISKGAVEHMRSLMKQSSDEQTAFMKFAGKEKITKKTFENYNTEIVVPREIDAMTKEKPLLDSIDLKDPAAVEAYSKSLLESHARSGGEAPTEFSLLEIERDRILNYISKRTGVSFEEAAQTSAYEKWVEVANTATTRAAEALPEETKQVIHSVFTPSPARVLAADTQAAYDTVTKNNEELHKKLLKAVGVMGISALGIGLSTLLGADEAEAGVISNAAKGIFKAAKVVDDGAKAAFETGLVGRHYNPKTGDWARMGRMDVTAMAAAKYGEQKNWIRATQRWIFGSDKLMSSASTSAFYEPLADPGVALAHAATQISFNTRNQLALFDDIIKGVGGKSMAKEMSADVMPILEEYGHIPAALESVTKQLENAQRARARFTDNKAKATFLPDVLAKKTAEIDGRIETLLGKMDELAPKYEQYKAKMTEYHNKWIDQNPYTRIYLALDDTPDFVKYPQLKGKLTASEQLAVDRIRAQNMDISDALLGLGEKPIQGPYVHYSLPEGARELLNSKAAAVADERGMVNGIPWTKIYSRGQFTLPAVPDIMHVQPAYVADIERRLGMMGFWDKQNPNGWAKHANSDLVKNSPGLSNIWDRIKTMTEPREFTSADVWANRYGAFEATRLLFGSVSAGAKHLFKQLGNISQYGAGTWARNLVPAARIAVRNAIPEEIAGRFGMKGSQLNEVVEAITTQNRYYNAISDMEFGGRDLKGLDKYLQAFAHKGGIFINGIEKFDRTLTVLASLEMAAKKGMTAEQAVYGVMDSILKNNFLSGPLNATWMRDPKIRALALFQTTPMKILERKMTNFANTWGALKDTYKELRSMTPQEALAQVKELRHYITQGEAAFKQNVIADALFSRKDVFGTPATVQFMRDMIASSLVATGGAAMGMDLSGHVFHLPFVSTEGGKASLRVSPIAQGALKTWDDYVHDNDFTTTTFFKNWLGRQHIIPTAVHKAMRVGEGDIPDMYKGSWLQYLFSVPATEQKSRYGTR